MTRTFGFSKHGFVMASGQGSSLPLPKTFKTYRTSSSDMDVAGTGLMHAPHIFASGVLSGFPQYSQGGPYISTL